MGFNQVDINYLLGFLEQELHCRDSKISELQSERSLEYLYSARYNQLDFCENECIEKKCVNENQTGRQQNNPLLQLEDLIATQHKAQSKLKEQIIFILEKHNLVCTELQLEKVKHEHINEENVKRAILLMQEREKLNLELQELKFKRERLKDNPGELEEAHQLKRHKTVVDKLVKRRGEIQEELRSDCQKCIQLENVVEEVKKKVRILRARLDCTKEDVFKAIKNISKPFHEQVNMTEKEFGILKSRISDITSLNDQIRIKINHLKDHVKCKEKYVFCNARVLNSCVENQAQPDSKSISNSLLDTFDSTIRLLEKEIEDANLRNSSNHSIDYSTDLAPHPTPNKPSFIRTGQRISKKLSNFECPFNSNNVISLSEQSKSCPISSSNLIPVWPSSVTHPRSHLPAINPLNVVNNIRKSSAADFFSINSMDLPMAPPPSLSASPVGKKLSISLLGKGKQLPPPLPMKPASRTPQTKPMTTVKHLIMPSKTLS